MAFMMKRKRYKFNVELTLEELSEVSYSKAILFAKVRQLDGGNFEDHSKRMEVQNHRVKYATKFSFPCKMNASASSGILETCKCRVSIRIEEKGGKHFRKLGFSDINLAEYAGAGPCTQRYILQPYDQSHRLDNSILQISLNITLKEGDTIFQRPLTRKTPISLPGEEVLTDGIEEGGGVNGGPMPHPAQIRKSVLTVPELNRPSSVTSGRISNTAPPTGLPPSGLPPSTSSLSSVDTPPSSLTLASLGVDSTPTHGGQGLPEGTPYFTPMGPDPQSHTRNSSATSQASVGYGSQASGIGQAGGGGGGGGNLGVGTHSRQSSSGESSHGRNMSQGSADLGFGSMEKEKRRKMKLDEGRRDPESVINELMEQVDLDKATHDDAETSGLQLYVGTDGTVSFDKNRGRDFVPVLIPSEPR